jgi:hypothetical protein
MKRPFKRALDLLLIPVAAAIVFFEEALIRYLNVAMAALARVTAIARFEAWLKTLPPYGAFVALIAPWLLLLPVKFAALWFVAHQQVSLAISAAVIGKVLGTALIARAYRILHPSLVQIAWFAAADSWFFGWRDRIYAYVKSMAAWRLAHAMVHRLKASLRGMVAGWLAR